MQGNISRMPVMSIWFPSGSSTYTATRGVTRGAAAVGVLSVLIFLSSSFEQEIDNNSKGSIPHIHFFIIVRLKSFLDLFPIVTRMVR